MRDTAITGAAGAYFVAGELSLRGWIASLTWGNAPRTDVLAQRLTPPQAVAIQVKTRASGDFQVGTRAEKPAPPESNEWYVLVTLPEPGEQSDYYILPRNHMSALIYIGFEAWLAGGKPGGRPRQRHSHRAFNPREFEGYRDRWDLLDRHASDAPWLLPEWVWSAAEGGIGLPEGHPGLGRPTTAG